MRPPAVYGPGDRAFLVLFRLAARHGVFPLLGDGRQELSLVFARDLARALVAAANSPATLGGTYHAAHAEVVSQRALGLALGRALARPVRFVRLPGPLLVALLHAGRALGRARGPHAAARARQGARAAGAGLARLERGAPPRRGLDGRGARRARRRADRDRLPGGRVALAPIDRATLAYLGVALAFTLAHGPAPAPAAVLLPAGLALAAVVAGVLAPRARREGPRGGLPRRVLPARC